MIRVIGVVGFGSAALLFLAGVPVLCLLVSPAARAQDAKIEITEFGHYSARTTGFKPNPNDPTGREGLAENVKLLEQTDKICARLDLSFGIGFRLIDGGRDVLPQVRIVTRYPPDGVVNAKGERFQSSEGTETLVPGTSSVRLYSFDETWEMVAGIWSFEIYHRGAKVAEQRFIVATHCGIS